MINGAGIGLGGLVAAVGTGAAVLVLTGLEPGGLRLAAILPGRPRRRPRPRPGQGPATDHVEVRGRRLAELGAAAGTFGLVGGVVGAVLAIGAGLVAHRVLGRLEPRNVRRDRERAARDLPVAAHLLASALVAGAAPVAATELVAAGLGGPVGRHLGRIAALARLGGDLATAWRTVDSADHSGQLAPLARTVARAIDTGAPLADTLDRLARELRSRQRFEVDRLARSVGVRAAAPLGLCFLPAFLLIGVVPVVVGVATSIFSSVV